MKSFKKWATFGILIGIYIYVRASRHDDIPVRAHWEYAFYCLLGGTLFGLAIYVVKLLIRRHTRQKNGKFDPGIYED